MRIHQIAIYVPCHAAAIFDIDKVFGKSKWASDCLSMGGEFVGKISKVDLLLSFNHEIIDNGLEFELITASNKEHWHDEMIEESHGLPFLSHLGIYCNTVLELEVLKEKMLREGYEVLQHTISYNHSNKRAGDIDKSSREYFDVIFNSRERMGFNLKLSAKVES